MSSDSGARAEEGWGSDTLGMEPSYAERAPDTFHPLLNSETTRMYEARIHRDMSAERSSIC